MDISVSDAPVGRLLDGRYRIEALLARGGMATVYRAVDTRLDRLVALKVMHAELAADDDFVARFIGEARSAAKLSDPNVVNVFDQGEDDGAVFLAMEYIEGRTLRDVLHERGRLGAALALEVAESVLSALAAAHRAGIVHRDIKPENVLVGNDGRVKVADFGLARAVSSSSKTTRGLLGTVSYISPEQALGEKATPRSDVYSAGIMLFEVLTGRPPHDGPTDFVVVRSHIDEDVPPPSESAPLPPGVDRLVQTATARAPGERYADCAEFLEAVRVVRAGLAGDDSYDPDATEAMVLSEIHAESRDSAGVTLDEALAETVLAGHLVTPADTDGSGRAGADEDGDAADGDETADDAAGPAAGAEGDDLAGDEPADSVPADSVPVDSVPADSVPAGPAPAGRAPTNPPPPPPGRTSTRVIGTSGRDSGRAGRAGDAADPDDASAEPTSVAAQSQAPGRRRDRRRSRRGMIMFVLVLLLAVAVAVGAWWFGAGRWASTPSLLNLTPAQAEAAAAEGGFSLTDGGERFSETVKAGQIVETDPGPGEQILDGGEITYVVSKGPERYKVPDLGGRTVEAATQALGDRPLTVRVTEEVYHPEVAKGRVVSQTVEAGERVRPDTEVGVVVSRGPEPIEIEDFTGRSADEAETTLSEAGLEVSRSQEFSDDVAAGLVISQDPADGTAHRGDQVELVVSQGPEMVQIPGVIGVRVNQAERDLRALGFEVERVDLLDGPGDGNPRVVRVDPAGSTQPHGSTLTLYHF
ncbi:serine/threonine-protein kinase [Haloactinopolyspora alba]|uniref:non-specific serine/threonine protein kinase n=1 Tax=Haloactinopolyspora alba TaxID=648780 RepID=A0A2P8DEB6_9ACTN|nr:Stk1 family PASTA domain-containing Ser/Thr kinase [Haloactinopolyspora alba]PSK95545.1 serine/threonine-protein kinase [Haloactinopolyspora alba]